MGIVCECSGFMMEQMIVVLKVEGCNCVHELDPFWIEDRQDGWGEEGSGHGMGFRQSLSLHKG